MNLKSAGKEFMSIHEDFFSLDKQEKRARIDLAYPSPSEIISQTVRTGTPLLSEEFLSRLLAAYDDIPDRYKLDISVTFNDLEEYSEEQLKEIFRKNMLLNLRILNQKARRQNRLVLVLCAIGLVFILLSVWLDRLWTEESTFRNIAFFFMDIVATVPFWGAMDIYLVEGSKRRKNVANIRKRFNSISFHLM